MHAAQPHTSHRERRKFLTPYSPSIPFLEERIVVPLLFGEDIDIPVAEQRLLVQPQKARDVEQRLRSLRAASARHNSSSKGFDWAMAVGWGMKHHLLHTLAFWDRIRRGDGPYHQFLLRWLGGCDSGTMTNARLFKDHLVPVVTEALARVPAGLSTRIHSCIADAFGLLGPDGRIIARRTIDVPIGAAQPGSLVEVARRLCASVSLLERFPGSTLDAYPWSTLAVSPATALQTTPDKDPSFTLRASPALVLRADVEPLARSSSDAVAVRVVWECIETRRLLARDPAHVSSLVVHPQILVSLRELYAHISLGGEHLAARDLADEFLRQQQEQQLPPGLNPFQVVMPVLSAQGHYWWTMGYSRTLHEIVVLSPDEAWLHGHGPEWRRDIRLFLL
jgi:hypothetical protein